MRLAALRHTDHFVSQPSSRLRYEDSLKYDRVGAVIHAAHSNLGNVDSGSLAVGSET